MEPKEIINSERGRKIIFYLLEDFHTKTDLTRKVFPHSKYPNSQNKNHPSINNWFNLLRGKYEFKKDAIKSKPVKRKGDNKEYIKTNSGYRLRIKDFLKEFTSFNFDERTLKILETLCYPRNIRKRIFNENDFNNDYNLENLFFNFMQNYFIVDYLMELIEPEKKDSEGNRDERLSVVNFDKEINKERTPEELSRAIFNRITLGSSILSHSSYFSAFMDKKFIFNLIKGFKSKFLLKTIESKLFGICVEIELRVNNLIQEQLTLQGDKPSEQEKYDPGKHVGLIDYFEERRNGIFWKLREDFKNKKLEKRERPLKMGGEDITFWLEKLEKTEKVLEEIKGIEKELIKNKGKLPDSVSENDFIPKIEQWDEYYDKRIEGINKKLKIPKL